MKTARQSGLRRYPYPDAGAGLVEVGVHLDAVLLIDGQRTGHPRPVCASASLRPPTEIVGQLGVLRRFIPAEIGHDPGLKREVEPVRARLTCC